MTVSGALDGIRVVDLTRYIPGPYCTQILGDLGADVVKVEEPGVGDATRMVAPLVEGESVLHAVLNRNKRSVVVDLRTAEGVEIARRLAVGADVFVSSFRPGVLERKGLDAGTLRAQNPRLVCCALSGYGTSGPLAQRAGHDLNYAARGGLLGAQRDPADRPVIPGAPVADMSAALLAAIGILAALQARERSGAGQVVDVSLLGGIVSLMTVPASRLLAGGAPRTELTGSHACYNIYRCRDGRYLAVGALEPKFWESLCRALGHPERIGRQWEEDPGRQETLALFAGTFAGRDRDEWLELLDGAQTCVEPVLDPVEALLQEQLHHGLQERSLPGGGRMHLPTFPVGLSTTPVRQQRAAPGPGEHTDEVMREAGFSRDEIEALRSSGVLA